MTCCPFCFADSVQSVGIITGGAKLRLHHSRRCRQADVSPARLWKIVLCQFNATLWCRMTVEMFDRESLKSLCFGSIRLKSHYLTCVCLSGMFKATRTANGAACSIRGKSIWQEMDVWPWKGGENVLNGPHACYSSGSVFVIWSREFLWCCVRGEKLAS